MPGLADLQIRTVDQHGRLYRSGFRWLEQRPNCRVFKMFAGLGGGAIACIGLISFFRGGGTTALLWTVIPAAFAAFCFWWMKSCFIDRALIFVHDGSTELSGDEKRETLPYPHRDIVSVEVADQPYGQGAMMVALFYESGERINVTANQFDPDAVRIIVMQIKAALRDIRQAGRPGTSSTPSGVEW